MKSGERERFFALYRNILPCDDTILCKNEMLSYQGQNKSNGLACNSVNLLQKYRDGAGKRRYGTWAWPIRPSPSAMGFCNMFRLDVYAIGCTKLSELCKICRDSG